MAKKDKRAAEASTPAEAAALPAPEGKKEKKVRLLHMESMTACAHMRDVLGQPQPPPGVRWALLFFLSQRLASNCLA